MSTAKVTLVANEGDATLAQLVQGKIVIAPSQRFPDPADELIVGMAPRLMVFRAGSVPQLDLVPNDLVGPQQEDGTPGWTYSATYFGVPGYADGYSWSFYLLSTNGATQYLSALASVPAAQPGQQYVPWPQTPPTDGQVFGWDGSQVVAVDQSSGSGTVTSVSGEPANGFTVSVADETTTPEITVGTSVSGLLKGSDGALAEAEAGTDYVAPTGSGADLTGITAAQVGADASGAASTAQTAAETYAAGQASAAQSAAETYAAGVASTAQSNAETYAAGVASTAQGNAETFATSAVGTETTRAEGAEGTLSTAISTETTRAETAEALKVPLTQRGAVSGVATLDSGGHVPTTQLPAATTSAQGAVILDGTAGDIQPTGIQGAGASGKSADAGHVHPYTVAEPLTSGESVVARVNSGSTAQPDSGTIFFTYFTATKTETCAHVVTAVAGTAASGLTAAALGIYSVDVSGNLTRIASVSDTTMWTGTYTNYTRAWAASWSKVAGTRYAFAVLAAGSVTPALSVSFPGFASIAPPLLNVLTGQSSLPSTVPVGNLGGDYRMFSGLVTP